MSTFSIPAADRLKFSEPPAPAALQQPSRRPAAPETERPPAASRMIGTTRTAQAPANIRRKEECPPEVYIG